MQTPEAPTPRSPMSHNAPRRVGWMRGGANRELAELLGDIPMRLAGDLDVLCIENRIDLIIAKRMPRSTLAPVIVPSGFDPDVVEEVVIAVGTGPHTSLAVATGARLAAILGVHGVLMTARLAGEPVQDAEARLDAVLLDDAGDVPLDLTVVDTEDVRALAGRLSPSTLLIHGQGGGSFIERRFTGTGHRLTARASGGVLVVRDAPLRCYRVMEEPTPHVLSSEMTVRDGMHLLDGSHAPVVWDGRLVGTVTKRALVDSRATDLIGDHIEEARSVVPSDPIDAATTIIEDLGEGRVPVVDDDRRVLGIVSTR